MLPLSPNAAKAVEKLFFAEQRQEVVRLLTEKCADNLPNCKDQDEYGLEDRRFQVLKLSGGNIDKLHDAIRMANEDWRDVMLAAGSVTAYKRKLLGEGLERNAKSDAALRSGRWNTFGAIAAFLSSLGLQLLNLSAIPFWGFVLVVAVIYIAGSHILKSWPHPLTLIAITYFGISSAAGYFVARVIRMFL